MCNLGRMHRKIVSEAQTHKDQLKQGCPGKLLPLALDWASLQRSGMAATYLSTDVSFPALWLDHSTGTPCYFQAQVGSKE